MSPPDLCVTFSVELWIGVSHWIPYGANEGGWPVVKLVSQLFTIGWGVGGLGPVVGRLFCRRLGAFLFFDFLLLFPFLSFFPLSSFVGPSGFI